MKQLLLLLLLSLFTGFIFGISIQHAPPLSYGFGEDVKLMVEVVDGQADIFGMKAFFRNAGDIPWMSETAIQESPGSVYYWTTIPAKYFNDTEMEYYFEIQLVDGSVENYPPLDGITPKYTLIPKAMEGELNDGFVLLTEEETVSSDEGYLLAVSFFALEEEIDPASIEVWVGGRDVTYAAQISAPTIMYREDKPTPGIKKAVIKAKLGSKQIHSNIWLTEVIPGTYKHAIPFTIRGSASFASNVYGYSDKDAAPGVSDNDAAAWADLYGTYGKVNLQTNLYVSSLEKTNQQPVNRYTFGVQVPMLDIYAGDYAPSLSQFTLYNKSIRGLYARFYGRAGSITWAHGKSMRATTNDALIVNDSGRPLKSGTFAQEAIAAKFTIGSDRGFSMGFTASRHRDIVSSLDSLYYKVTYTPTGADTVSTAYSTMAKDNAVLSYDIKINVPKHNIVLGAEIAGSMLNKNTIPGAIDKETISDLSGIDDFPIDPQDYSGIFVINKNMEPFMPSRANVAWLAYYRMLILNNLLNIQYAETGSAFNALGASYQLQDSKSLAITNQLNIAHCWVFSGGYNLTADNLMGFKSETNTFNSWFVQSMLRLPRYPYLKAAYFNNAGENKINPEIESANPFQHYLRNSKSMSFGMGYNFSQIPYVPSQLDISYRIGYDDSQLAEIYQTDNENNGINLTLSNKYTAIPLTTQFSMSLGKQKKKMSTPTIVDDNQKLFFGAGYSLWEDSIKPF
ncbi:MAG: hypothetical protein PHO75_04355, partial [Candidatus Shapirobacteria bacterium]|nr:hypothetical protein [Candidatus Shapirobacteria bacterium]